MGRFDSTARTYAAHREPYPPAFFSAVAEALHLDGREALIDLGTGPGLLALGFAPYVGRIVGVDPEPAMVAEARRAAMAAAIEFPVIEGRAEDIPADLGCFDLISIGRALHWMGREATLAMFDRTLAPDGRIVVCGSTSAGGDVNPWRTAYESVLRSWGERRDGSHRRIYEHWFDGTRYARVTAVTTPHTQEVTPLDLIDRALTRSSSSPAVIGWRIETFRSELLRTLAPFFPDGRAQEVIKAKAVIFAAIR